MKYTMKELPAMQRPYEKCLSGGPESLNDAELLAIIMRSGTKGTTAIELAYRILKLVSPKGGLAGLYKITVKELCEIKGIGKVKAIQLKCIAELSKRIASVQAQDGLILDSAGSVADFCMEQLRHMDHEEVHLLSFNSKCRLLAQKKISVGTVNQSSISPREIYMEAMKQEASYIILVHNHPSGDPHPSKEDDLLTARTVETGKLLGIEMMDHIIIGNQSYYSYREHN